MSDSIKLKPLRKDAIEAAIERAEHYRFLNDPEQAESICLDVLAADSGNQRALIDLILSITDQFMTPGGVGRVNEVREFVAKLSGEYEQAYYSGITLEREARAILGQGLSNTFAYDLFHDALDAYETAHHAINGKSGLRFQFENSVLPDGFWYEGAPAYHYYALNAIRWTLTRMFHTSNAATQEIP